MSIGPDEVRALAADLESDRVERTVSTKNTTKFREAICAFANDLAGHERPGYLLIGVADDGRLVGAPVTDELLLYLAGLRNDGQIQPLPSMLVYRVEVTPGVTVAVVEVAPSDWPPVRTEGRVRIRVGPRRELANPDEERRLSERRVARAHAFDQRPCLGSSVSDLDLNSFQTTYLPALVAADVLDANERSVEHRLSSVRFFDPLRRVPTYGGLIVIGLDPLAHVPGDYVTLVRFDGDDLGAPIIDSKDLRGNLLTLLRDLDSALRQNIRTARQPADGFRFEEVPDYPVSAVRELAMNAVMHREYEVSNAPVRINWFRERIEIQNPGGLYGRVRADNFGTVNDYRNPVLGEAMKALGFVERYGTGITRARDAMKKNGNPPPEFEFDPSTVLVTLRRRP